MKPVLAGLAEEGAPKGWITARDEEIGRNRDFLANRAAEICRAAGAKQVFRLDWAPLILHVQSSMRMGHREQDSVVGPTGEARFVDGLDLLDPGIVSTVNWRPDLHPTPDAVAAEVATWAAVAARP